MRWQTKVRPPNRDVYLDRCKSLSKAAGRAEIMPPILVVANCWFVLKRALGSDWRVLHWIILNIVHDRWENLKERAWWNWQMYVMLRTRDEIIELLDQYLERITGDDHREWPNVITVDNAPAPETEKG